MKELVEEIYEEYLKPRNKEYSMTNTNSKLLKVECALINSFNLNQRKNYEEIEYLSKKLQHEQNLELIKFVIDYLNKKEEG